MDKQALKAAIQKIEDEAKVHSDKFAGNTVHQNCPERFEKVLNNLRADLEAASNAEPEPGNK